MDITAEEAWPSRPPRQPLPEPREVAEACAALVACLSLPFGSTYSDDELAVLIYQLSVCPFGTITPFVGSAVEMVIPLYGSNESWDFLLRAVVDARGDCVRIRQALTLRPSWISCQEDGCYAMERHRVTCNGDIATFDEMATQTRDCSRSRTTCSETSPTGCTDRALVRCTCGGKDRCDGDIKLGCDSCGFVSYRDCSWDGRRCEETTNGARCAPPFDTSVCVGGGTCNGSSLSLCTTGGMIDVDCSAIPGMQCVSWSAVSDGGDALLDVSCGGFCTRALCSPCGPGECGLGASDAGPDSTRVPDAASDGAGAHEGGRGGVDGGNSLPSDASLD